MIQIYKRVAESQNYWALPKVTYFAVEGNTRTCVPVQDMKDLMDLEFYEGEIPPNTKHARSEFIGNLSSLSALRDEYPELFI